MTAPVSRFGPYRLRRLRLLRLCLMGIVTALVLPVAPAAAKTAVTSNITTNTTWTATGSPYDLDSSKITISSGITLTIEPGVTVDFNAGESATLWDDGTIKALGTAASPIIFTSSQALLESGAPGQYNGLNIESGNASSSFSYTNFYYGAPGSGHYFGYAVLKIRKGSTVTIDHSIFEHNAYSGIGVSEGGTANVSSTTLVNNGGGLSAIGENIVHLNHDTIANNTEAGVFWDAPEKPTKATEMSVMYNTIRENSSDGISIWQNCPSQSSFPHGEYNNIYANGGTREAKKQLETIGTCKALSVDWENNYWGPESYYRPNDPRCAGTSTPYPGHVAYLWSKPSHEWEVPLGPLSSGQSGYQETVGGKSLYYGCGWDTFNISTVLSSPVANGAPEPTGSVLYGEGSLAAPNLMRISCGDPVNCVTGNFHETYTDLSVPGLNNGLTFTRTYNSQSAAGGTHGPLGYGWSFEFGESVKLDPSGQSATVTNADGSTVTFTYLEGAWRAPAWVQATLSQNGEGVFTYTLPDQRAFTFNNAGVLQKITDRNGNTTSLAYAEGRLTSVTDPSGRKLSIEYNTAGTISAITAPEGRKEQFEYDSSGNLTASTDPRSDVTHYGYNTLHEMTSITDPRSGKVVNEYDSNWRVIAQTDALSRKTTWSYASGETKVTAPTGSVMQILFSNNLPTSITRAYGTASASTTSYGYDENDNLTFVTDPNDHKTTYGYDSAGNRTSQTDPEGHETKWSYDSTHDVISVTTPDGETTTIERDSHGNATKISRPAPGSTTQESKFEYDSHGNLTAMIDPLGRKWTYGYDSYGDRTSATDPEGDKTTWGYNEDSWLTSQVSPRGNVTGGEPSKYTTTIERDAQGRPLTITDPLGHKTSYTYDANGNKETETDPNNHKTTFVYDADNELIKVEEPNGTIVETGYDADGRITSQTDGNKHTTKYVRNLLEEITETVDPLGRKTTKEYDAAGNLTVLTDAAKRTTTYTYNKENQPTKITYSDGKTHTVEYGYNPDGLRTSMIDGTGTTTYTYDQLDRLTKTEDGHGDTVGYEYDLANEQTQITYPNGKTITRTYDKAGRLAGVTDWLEHTIKFSYNPDSYLTATLFPSASGEEDTYAYNEADQQTATSMLKGPETLASLAYTRDSNGQVTKTVAKGLPGAETTEYGYDENERLAKAGSSSYEYDAANNPTKLPSGTNTYDAASELIEGTNIKYTYDELGERTKTTPTTGPATSYAYDQAGNLTSIARPEEGETPKIEDSYTYNGDGLRASQTISGATTYLAWELNEAVPSLLNDGMYSYIYGSGNLPIEQINGSGTVLYLHHDQQGSTRLITGSAGTVEGAYTYDAYGNQAGRTGSATAPLGYDAQYTSSDTGLIYLRARSYDPNTAQFMSVDPLFEGTNTDAHATVEQYVAAITSAYGNGPYVYADDNPLNNYDPAGLLTVGICVHGEVNFIVHIGVSGCAQASTSGEVGGTVVGSGGLAQGAGVGATVGPQVSNAEHISELSGPFANAGGQLGVGPDISLEAFGAPGNCGPVVGGGFSAGLGAGVARWLGGSYTGTWSVSF